MKYLLLALVSHIPDGHARYRLWRNTLLRRMLLLFLVIVCIRAPIMYAQSNITIDARAAITIETGADISAYAKTVNGMLSGGGTWNGSFPLPVELFSFTAFADKNGVTLSWKTATEVNNYGFEIERAMENRTLSSRAETRDDNWSKIGFVEGNGTTNAPKSYSFVDKSASGKTSYRLKQIDRDGKFEYSQTVEVTALSAPKEFGLEQNYPNPFNPTTAISFQLSENGFTSLKVYDAIGREVATLVSEVKEAGYYSVQFDGAKLSSGIYFAKLTSSGKTQMRKLLLLK